MGFLCASGSDAILLTPLAPDIGPGDEVIVPSFTPRQVRWCAWCEAGVCRHRPTELSIDPSKWKTRSRRPRGRLFPCICLVRPRKCGRLWRSPPVAGCMRIEDAAQAIGATFGERAVGGIGSIGCTSFYPTKNLGKMGDGGTLTTQDDALARSAAVVCCAWYESALLPSGGRHQQPLGHYPGGDFECEDRPPGRVVLVADRPRCSLRSTASGSRLRRASFPADSGNRVAGMSGISTPYG